MENSRAIEAKDDLSFACSCAFCSPLFALCARAFRQANLVKRTFDRSRFLSYSRTLKMSFGVPIFQRGLSVAFVLAIGFSRAFAGASFPADQSILFSTPQGGALTTNFNQLNLESSKPEDHFPSLHPFDGNTAPSSLSPVAPRPIIQNGGVKELLQRQKDWEVTSPEEAMQHYMVRQVYGSREASGSESKGAYSEMELYSQRMSRSAGSTNSTAQNRSALGQSFDSIDGGDSNPFTAMSGTTSSDNSSLAPGFGRPQGLSDILGIGKRSDSTAAATLRFQQEQRSQLEEFRKILNGSSPASAVAINPLSPGNVPGAAPTSVFGGQYSAPDAIAAAISPGATPLTPRAPSVEDFMPRVNAPTTPTAPGQSSEASRNSTAASRPKPAEASFDAPMRRF